MAEALFLDLSTNQNRWSVLRPPLINPMPTVKYNQYFSVTYFISNQWSCKTFDISKILPITNAISIPPQNTRNVRSSSICGLVFPVFWSKNGNYKISNSFYRCLSRLIYVYKSLVVYQTSENSRQGQYLGDVKEGDKVFQVTQIILWFLAVKKILCWATQGL